MLFFSILTSFSYFQNRYCSSTLYDSSEYVGHCYVKCYPEQQKAVIKWIETIRREVLPENIPSQVRTFQDDLYEVQAL